MPISPHFLYQFRKKHRHKRGDTLQTPHRFAGGVLQHPILSATPWGQPTEPMPGRAPAYAGASAVCRGGGPPAPLRGPPTAPSPPRDGPRIRPHPDTKAVGQGFNGNQKKLQEGGGWLPPFWVGGGWSGVPPNQNRGGGPPCSQIQGGPNFEPQKFSRR